MPTMDIQRLVLAIRRTPPEQAFFCNTNAYLQQNLIDPFLCGSAVPLASLDYTQFTIRDINAVWQELEVLSMKLRQISQFTHKFQKAGPVAGNIQSFC